jgi:hypothetical protein
MNKEHIENKLAMVRAIFEETSSRIEALRPGERLIATALAKTLGNKYGISGPSLYPIINLLIKDYPNTKMHRGAKGGLEKIDPVINTVADDSAK